MHNHYASIKPVQTNQKQKLNIDNMETQRIVDEAREEVAGVTFGGVMLGVSPRMDRGSHKSLRTPPEVAGEIQEDFRDEAALVNEAHDVVTSNGTDIEPQYSEEKIERRLQGNNSVGPAAFIGHGVTQQLGRMAHGSNRRYDIKNGVAVRGKQMQQKTLAEEMVKPEEVYVPFAPQHQEAAKKAIRSLGEKQMRAINERERAEAVRKAKAVLGRSGNRIPKPKA